MAGPTINTDPASVTANDQTAVTLSVTDTTSGGSLTYQWKDNRSGSFANVTDGSGATSASYTTAVLGITASGRQYLCAVTDSNGTTSSLAATVTVIPLGQNMPFVFPGRPLMRRRHKSYPLETRIDIRGWWG